MPESTAIDSGTLSDLCMTFKVSKSTCEYYNKYYNDKILPRIQRNYLAHLVISIEEIIDEKIKNDRKKDDPKNTSDKKTRDFSIILHPDPPQGKEAVAECLPNRACIKYKPTNDYKKLRIIIAHELGHVLRNYKIILGNDPENHANLFAYFAISGKNKFYKSKKVEDLIYPNEGDIISKIQAVCQIEEYRQIDKISPIKNEENI